MRITDYDHTLSMFGLEKLKKLADLSLNSKGNIAITRDGDLQMGEPRVGALFRLIERWRVSQSTIEELVAAWWEATNEIQSIQSRTNRASLAVAPREYWNEVESIAELKENAAILAGAVFVVLSNFVDRFRKDLGVPPSAAVAGTAQQPFDAVVVAAAANFRHYDEWASANTIADQQRRSLSTLCTYLGIPTEKANGSPGIRSNVCGEVLTTLSAGSADNLHHKLFDYAKTTAHYNAL